MVSYDDVREAMIGALAEINGLDTTQVEAGLAALGDDYLFELDSKEAEWILGAVEVVIGRRLPCPADLGQEQYASVGTLIDVVLKEI